MARPFNEQEFQRRRDQILDAALHLIYTKGYAQMTIQDILDQLRISKGAFYHYFDSKQAVMEALVERMFREVQALVQPLLADPQVPALEKLHRFFGTISRWKLERKEFVWGLLQAWYSDDNALMRYQVQMNTVDRVAEMLSMIIAQGVQEGVMHPVDQRQAGRVVLHLIQGMNEGLAVDLLTPQARRDNERMAASVAAFTQAIERVLGTAPGSICLLDEATLQEWVEALDKQAAAPVQDFPPWSATSAE